MNIPVKQRLISALLFLVAFAVMSSLVIKALALICYAIAFIALISASMLAVGQVETRQRKTAFILIPVVAVLVGVGTYVFFNLLHR